MCGTAVPSEWMPSPARVRFRMAAIAGSCARSSSAWTADPAPSPASSAAAPAGLGNNAISLTKEGSGTQTLSGANTYKGSTTISGGTLEFSGTNTIGAVTANGGNVSFIGGNTTISGNLSQTMNDGIAITISNSVVTMNQLYSSGTGDAGTAFTIGTGADVTASGGTYSRTFRGSGGMFLNGGTLRTSYLASNSASGPWWINDRGYIHFNGTRIVATADQANFIQLAAGANYGNENFARLNATTTFDTAGFSIGIGVILNGVGGLTKDGSGTLTLSGANSYTGATTVNAGALAVDGSHRRWQLGFRRRRFSLRHAHPERHRHGERSGHHQRGLRRRGGQTQPRS